MSFLQLVLSLDKTIKEIILLWRICQFDRYRNNYHINRIKRAKEVTPDGLADMYEQLRDQIGLPNDACALPVKSSAAQLRIK